MLFVIVIFLFLKPCTSVIYSVNETEYLKMPPLYAMDDYQECMAESDGTYCIVDFELFSRQRSSLMHFIQQYSEYSKKHYNHTQLHRGVCVTGSCKNFLRNATNRTADLNSTIERCVNETIWKKYGIEARLANIQYCNRKDDKKILSKGDFVFLGIYGLLFLLNIIGTFYDSLVSKNGNKTGNTYLLAFSLKRNWRRMVASAGKGPDPRLERLKVINGLRTMTMACVIFSHTALTLVYTYLENPLFTEKAYDNPAQYILFNGTLVTFTYFVMSAFLLVYNFLIHGEKHEITWLDFPKAIALRWLRLTVPYGLIIGTLATIMRHLGSGPLWKNAVVSESDACSEKWWMNILYINNYLYGGINCLPQTWYLAADTQLFCFAVLVLVVFRTFRSRKIALMILFLISLLITAVTTYHYDLNGTLIQTPESFRSLYSNEMDFKKMYILGHTNLSSCVLGMAAAMLTYHWQNEKKDFSKYKGFVWIYWLTVPLGVAVILSGGIFYIDGIEFSLMFRTIYATFYKVIFELLVIIIMVGCIFKLEKFYRAILEWRGFTWMGRVSYSAFLLHTLFQRCLVGMQIKPIYVSYYLVAVLLHSWMFTAYMFGVMLFLFVEAPVAAVIKAVMAPSEKKETQQDNK